MIDSKAQPITPWTIVEFLFFKRDAIIKIAASKSAFWIGFLFVIAAGFAREYDGEYLVAEPWHLILPLAASLIGCGSMVLLIFLFLKCNRAEESSFAEVFRSFLNTYWMTGPLALVYGIPVERMFDPADATRANLYLLAIVSVWRVLLTIRCVQVLCSTSLWRSVVIVLLFCDILAMLALYFVPGPIFMIMGGVRLTESERIILQVRHFLILLCYGTILIWVIGYISICSRSRKLAFYRSREPQRDLNPNVERNTWLTALAAIAMWIPFLFFTQPEQRLRWQSEQMIEQGNFIKFGELTGANPREAFPPHWDPPPRVGYREREPRPFLVLHGLYKSNAAAPWVLDAYQSKLRFDISTNRWRDFGGRSEDPISTDELKKLVEVLEQMPDGAKAAREICSSLQDHVENSEDRSALITRIKSIVDSGENDETESDRPGSGE